MNISVVCCVYNTKNFERDLKPSLEKQIKKTQNIFLYNTENNYGVPSVLNYGVTQATGDIIVFVHEDIVLDENWIVNLENRVEEIEKFDPAWGVLGVAGRGFKGEGAVRFQDPGGKWVSGKCPARVQTLDECCLIIKKGKGLSFDERFQYHFYGADICLQSTSKGFNTYVVDCFLKHTSRGSRNKQFMLEGKVFMDKWREFLKGKTVYLTTGEFRFKDNHHKVYGL